MENFDWKFKTPDSALKEIKTDAIRFITDLYNKEYKFFTLLGPTERGKTLLLNDIMRFIKGNSSLFKFPYAKKTVEGRCDKFIIYGTLKELVSQCLGNPKRYEEIKTCGILFIEEFYNFNVINNYNAMVIEIAFDILNSRDKKAVVIDSNKMIKEIEELDVRISSRLHRNNSIVIEISDKVPMYLKRPKK